jgi:hypothetical protein
MVPPDPEVLYSLKALHTTQYYRLQGGVLYYRTAKSDLEHAFPLNAVKSQGWRRYFDQYFWWGLLIRSRGHLPGNLLGSISADLPPDYDQRRRAQYFCRRKKSRTWHGIHRSSSKRDSVREAPWARTATYLISSFPAGRFLNTTPQSASSRNGPSIRRGVTLLRARAACKNASAD